MNAVLVFAEGRLFSGALVAAIPFALLCLLSVLCIICIARQPCASTDNLSFVVSVFCFVLTTAVILMLTCHLLNFSAISLADSSRLGQLRSFVTGLLQLGSAEPRGFVRCYSVFLTTTLTVCAL